LLPGRSFYPSYLLRGPHDNPKPEDARKENFSIAFSIIMDLAWMGFFYLNAFVLIPKFVYQKNSGFTVFPGADSELGYFPGMVNLFGFANPDFRLRQFFFFNFFIFIFFLATSTAYQLIKDRMEMTNA
jgi:hypothetical protein